MKKFPVDEPKLPKDSAKQIDGIPAIARDMTKHTWDKWLVENDRWDDAMQAYLASASFADSMVGRLIEALEKGTIAKDTLIVLWSDHGYHLGHKQYWEKRVLWDQASHVPVVVVPPVDDKTDFKVGRCVRPVSLLDLYPTLVDLCDLNSVGHLEGKSLKPFLLDPGAKSERYVLITHRLNNHAIRSENYRYIRYSDGSEELYDHRNDPSELKNVADEQAYLAMKAKLFASIPNTYADMDPVPPNSSKQK